MNRVYAAAIWLSIATILAGLSLIFGVWGVMVVAGAVGAASLFMHVGRRAP